MKAILQIGPAQFVVEGATFHLLCEDIVQSLHSIIPIAEADVALTLHTDALERCLADDAQRLTSAGVPHPRAIHESDDVAAALSSVFPPSASASGVDAPRRLSTQRVRDPLNVFSADSFDAAEAMVQELQTCVLEQRRLLEMHALSSPCGAPHRVVPLPLLRLDTYLSTSADVLPEYNAAGQRRRSSLTVVGGEATPPPRL